MTRRPSKPWTRALFGCAGRDVAPELVLLGRLIAIAWLLTGHALLLPTRSVPFFEVLIPIADSPVVAWAELIVGGVCAAHLVLGRAVRGAALTLGSLIFVTTLLSRGFFSNNRLFTACVLVLVGLESLKAPPRLLRAQVVLLYVAAGLDKLLDTDWRSGAFVRSFASGLASFGRLWSPGQDAHSPHPPAQLFGALLDTYSDLAPVASCATIFFELAIGFAFLARCPRIAIPMGLAFHLGVLVYSGSPMGMFFYSATAAYLAYVHLPSTMNVLVPARFRGVLVRVLSVVDPDERCVVSPGQRFSLMVGGRTSMGAAALFALPVYLPAFYVVVAVTLSGPWFTLWLVLVLAPLLSVFNPLIRRSQTTKIRHMTGELNP